MKITLFKSLYNPIPHYTTVEKIFEAIKTGGKQKELIEAIRKEKDKEKRDTLKKQLGVILFSGKFSQRRNEGLMEYSKLICLDFDNADPSVRALLCEDATCFAVWNSPSGNGYKALFKVSTDDHVGHVKALCKEWPDADKLKDVARATFMSYDPNIYINEKALLYDKVLHDVHTDAQKLEKLKKWLENKGEKFVNGNRNNFLAKLAGAMNRFGLTREFAKEALSREYCSGDFSEQEAINVVESIYNNYAHQFDTESFENTFTDKKTDDILSATTTTQDIITLGQCEDDLRKDYDDGLEFGETTHFPQLDEVFRWLRGEVTVLTGHPGMGKTTMLNQLIMAKAVKEGKKAGFLSLEQYPPVYFYRELIRTYVGKPLERDRPNRMTRKEFDNAMEFVKEHFFYIYPERDDPTPEYTHARFLELIIKYGIHFAVTDPYNSQSHDYASANSRDDRYIASYLNKEKRFALQNNIYDIVVVHPKNIGKNDDGTYKEPSADSLNGGAAWWQKTDNMLMYHRPFVPVDYNDPTCVLGSLKIKKQPMNGRPGKKHFTYDYWAGRYYLDKFNPL